MNSLSQLQTIVSGSPFSQNQWLKNNRAIPPAVSVETVGTSWMSKPKWSVIEQTMSKLLLTGRGPTKLIAMLSPCLSGMGKGCNSPAGLVVLNFFLTVDASRDIGKFKIPLYIQPVVRLPKCGIGFICSEMA